MGSGPSPTGSRRRRFYRKPWAHRGTRWVLGGGERSVMSRTRSGNGPLEVRGGLPGTASLPSWRPRCLHTCCLSPAHPRLLCTPPPPHTHLQNPGVRALHQRIPSGAPGVLPAHPPLPYLRGAPNLRRPSLLRRCPSRGGSGLLFAWSAISGFHVALVGPTTYATIPVLLFWMLSATPDRSKTLMLILKPSQAGS